MKKMGAILILASISLLGRPAIPESSASELVWFGIDYSLVKFIGVSDDFSDLRDIQERIFRSWNEIVLAEKDKYDVQSAFGVSRVDYQMEFAISQSENRDMDGILQTEKYSIDKDQVTEVVMKYTDTADDRVGVLFVMETLNKLDQISTMWVAVFQISTGEIIHLERFAGKPGGFGIRNYWARSYYNVLNEIRGIPGYNL
jgi:hypothetical protein